MFRAGKPSDKGKEVTVYQKNYNITAGITGNYCCYSFAPNLLLPLQRGPWKRLLEKACLYFKGMFSRIIDRKRAQISIL